MLKRNLPIKIAIDLDGVLCEETKPYSKAKVIVEKKDLEFLKKKGCQIIIYTSRRERDKFLTQKWLKKNRIPYDKLVVGKFKADFYVDDKAVNNFEDLYERL